MKINTKELQGLIPVIKSAVGNNSLQPDTTRLGIKTTSDSIVFYSKGRDRLKKSLKIASPDQGVDIAVNANIFLGLLGKTTTDEIELSIDDTTKNLVFKGNGIYNIEQEVSEVGPIKFGEISTDNLTNSIGTLKKDFIKTIINNNTYALLKVKEGESEGRLSTGNYHIKTDNTMTSDSEVISRTNVSSGLSKDISLSPETINTIALTDEDLAVYEVGNDLLLVGSDSVISSPIVSDSNEFPYTELVNMIKDELFPSSVSVEKSPILSAIDRLSIFNVDNSPLKISFGNNIVEFSIKEQKESIVAIGDGRKPDGTDYVFNTDMTSFVSSLKAYNKDTVVFKFNVNDITIIRLDGDNLIEAVSSKS